MKRPEINGIDTARVFIPFPERVCENGNMVYSCPQDVTLYWYPRYRAMPNVDAKPWRLKAFYDLIGACYDIDVGTVPQNRPFIQWLAYAFKNQKRGMMDFADLAKYFNVLFVHDETEREFLKLVYLFDMAGIDVRMLYNPHVVPTRFTKYARQQMARGR